MNILKILLFSALLLMCPQTLLAQTFFSALPDLPLMVGLSEDHDSTLSFDKPEGRIIHGTAYGTNISITEVQTFYNTSLPQFGWTYKGQDTFVRKDETLRFFYHQENNRLTVHIQLTPRGL